MTPLLQKILLGYASLTSTVLLGIVLLGAKQPRNATFDELHVQRIDVVEPDGITRVVLSNRSRLPPVVIKGKEHPEMGEARPQAGLIFYNDEGTENGGLIFGGRKNEKARCWILVGVSPLISTVPVRLCNSLESTIRKTALLAWV